MHQKEALLLGGAFFFVFRQNGQRIKQMSRRVGCEFLFAADRRLRTTDGLGWSTDKTDHGYGAYKCLVMAEKIKFLGTAGARFVMIKQLRSSAGTWLTLEDKNLLLDPGPGTLVRCAKSRPPLDPTKLDAIILSHQHIDHANDVNIMIEAMTTGGYSKRGMLFAPNSALEDDPIVLRYIREYLNEIHVLKERSAYKVGEVEISTPLRHIHPVETYGIMFKTPRYTISFVTDTRFFPELIEKYKNSDLLVINVVRYDGKGGKRLDVDHLNLEDVKKLIGGIKPKRAILTHFGYTMVRSKPWELAVEVQEETGIKTIAASDGMEFDLEKEMV